MRPSVVARGLFGIGLPLVATTAQGLPEQEPNAGPAQATPFVLGSQLYGDLGPGDEDWFELVLPAAADLRAFTAPGFGVQCGDTRLGLFDAQGALVIEIDDGSPSTHGDYSLLERGNVAAGTWYLRVRGFDALTTGTYTIDVETMAPGQLLASSPTVLAIAEAPEPNDPRLPNSSTTAGPLWAAVNGYLASPAWTASLSIPGADYDFYKIRVEVPGLLTLATAPGAAPFAFDTVLHLCDGALTELAYDDDSGPGFQALLRYQVTTPGIYFVVVSGYGTGNYRLDVDFAPPLPAGAAMVSVLGGGCGPTGGVPRLGTRWTTGTTPLRIERPVLGTGYFVDLTNAPPNRLIARLFNLLPRQYPLSLTPFGAPGCVSEVDDPVVTFTMTDANGVHFWGFSILADVNLIGMPLEKQVAVLDPSANALGIRMSNRVTSVVGIGF